MFWVDMADLEVEESAGVELDGEVERVDGVADGDGLPALRVVGVSLDVHDAVEELVGDAHHHADAVGQAVDHDVRTGEVRHDRRRRRDGNAGALRKKKPGKHE